MSSSKHVLIITVLPPYNHDSTLNLLESIETTKEWVVSRKMVGEKKVTAYKKKSNIPLSSSRYIFQLERSPEW
jgi:hypothetical protein